jgi:hypothetical protein
LYSAATLKMVLHSHYAFFIFNTMSHGCKIKAIILQTTTR